MVHATGSGRNRPCRRATEGLRSEQIHLRVSPAEATAWRVKTEAAGVPLSDLPRQAMARTRTWTSAAAEVERDRTRQVARIDNNLNQIARCTNTHASAIDAIKIIANLVYLSQTLDKVAHVGEEADDARCRFITRGTGSARAAVDYLLGERDAAGKPRDGVEVRRGDPDMVAAVANALKFEHKYTSGVIA